jgi:serine/threonine protein kinase
MSVPFYGSFREVLVEACPLAGRTIDAKSDEIWIRCVNTGHPPPQQGWKIHVSTTWSDAINVLRQILPILISEKASFKVIATSAFLNSLNEGSFGRSQVGKFLTVYPESDTHATDLASKLHAATLGFRGPRVPSDLPVAPGSLVHYRYGAFGSRRIQTAIGSIEPAIETPEGELVADAHLPFYYAPAWVEDPFVLLGLSAGLPPQKLTVGDKYIIVSVIHSSIRGAVYLAIDIDNPSRCVLKRAYKWASVGLDGDDAQDRLRHEAEMLATLGRHGLSPVLLGMIQDDGDLYVAMEDIDGVTLEQYIVEAARQGSLPTERNVIEWGLQLADLLDALHGCGIVYRDLKSSNIIINKEGVLRLVDFELAAKTGEGKMAKGRGTRGYTSHRRYTSPKQKPRISDDVYGLGAVLYFMATGAEPSQAPNPWSLMDRDPRLINVEINEFLVEIIKRCLDRHSSARFQSIRQVAGAMRSILRRSVLPVPEFRERAGAATRLTGATSLHRYRRMASELGESLRKELCNVTREPGHSQYRSRDLNDGVAGGILALASLVSTSHLSSGCDALAGGARWLARAPRLPGPPLPGLFVGEAGIAIALLRAAQVLRDAELLAVANDRARWISTLPFRSPDLFNGVAGRIWFHILMWDETGVSEHLHSAIRGGEWLLDHAELGPDGGAKWTIPEGYGGLSGRAYYGRAHGAAGIADVLLDLFEISREKKFLDCATSAMTWIAKAAIPVLRDGRGLDWPSE